jgi:hypothetical protein
MITLIQRFAALIENGKVVSVPLEWIAVIGVVLVGAVGILWRDNLKLRAALLREKDECISILRAIRDRLGKGGISHVP